MDLKQKNSTTVEDSPNESLGHSTTVHNTTTMHHDPEAFLFNLLCLLSC